MGVPFPASERSIQRLVLSKKSRVKSQRALYRCWSFAFSDTKNAIGTDGRNNSSPFIYFLLIGKITSEVFRLEFRSGGKRPDFQEMNFFGSMCFFQSERYQFRLK